MQAPHRPVIAAALPHSPTSSSSSSTPRPRRQINQQSISTTRSSPQRLCWVHRRTYPRWAGQLHKRAAQQMQNQRSESTSRRSRPWRQKIRSWSSCSEIAKNSSIKSSRRRRKSLKIWVHFSNSFGLWSSIRSKIPMDFWKLSMACRAIVVIR